MIPRYIPDLKLSVWARWLTAETSEVQVSQAGVIRILNGNENTRNAFAFISARQCLYAYFKLLKQTLGKGTILIPAQICPVVTYIVKELGFIVRFVDSDISYPTPSVNQYLQAIDQDTIGIVISPLYGYIQADWGPLLEKLGRIKLILDLAQGIGLREYIGPLFMKADAVVYSFAIGKGLDTGGGLLLTSNPLNVIGYNHNRKIYYLSIMLKGALLWFSNISKLYPYLAKRLELAIEMEKKPDMAELSSCHLAPKDIYSLWNAKLQFFLDDITRARNYARVLGKLPLIQMACRDVQIFCNSNAIYLRQIIRFKDVSLRKRVLNTLQQCGVDCLPAGELLPAEYFDSEECIDYPNARAFREDSVRLPFLGRMSERKFNQFKQKLEDAIAQHIPH